MINKIKNIHFKFQKYYIFLILILGAVLRLRNILNRDFWYDEAFTGITVKSNFWDMIRITINDVHPPLYYMLLKPFAYFFDYSVFGIRFFSVIFGILGIWAIYLFTRELFNKKAALFASFVVAVSPFAIQYSQEGRMYAMLSFLIVMAAYFFVKALRSQNSYRYYILWGVFMGFSFLTHYMGVIFAVMYYFMYVAHNFFSERKGISGWKTFFKNILPDGKIIVGYVSSIMVFAFWIKTFINHLLYSGLNNMQWVRPASFSDILTNAQIFIFGSPLGDLSAGMPSPNGIHGISPSSILIGISLFFGFIVPFLLKKEKKIIYILLSSFGFMLLVYLISLLGDDYFVSRYLIISAYFIFVLLGVWLANINLKFTFFTLIVYVILLFNINHINYSKGYGELAGNLDKYKNNDFYVLNSYDYVIAKYYLGENHLILYNIDWPQYNPSYWAAIGPTLRRTESYNDLKNNPNAIILANIQKDKDKRNDKTFDPTGLPLVAKYENITLYKPSN